MTRLTKYLKSDDMDAPTKLNKILEREGFFNFYLVFGEGNLRFADWHLAVKNLPLRLKALVELFLLSIEVPSGLVIEILTKECVDVLLANKVISQFKLGFKSNSYILASHSGLNFFFQVSRNPSTYFGDDSIALSVFQSSRAKEKVLDLCSGSGIQAMKASLRAEKVDAVEISEEASSIAKLNCSMNGLGGKINIFNKDAVDFLAHSSGGYDLILFNPPLLPIPPQLNAAFVADGGSDGLALTSNIVSLGQERLNSEGIIQFIGTGLATDKNLLFLESVNDILLPSMSTRCALLSKHRIEEGGDFLERLVITACLYNNKPYGEVLDIFLNHYKSLNASFIYCYFLTIERNSNHKQTNHQIIDISKSHYGLWFV